MPFFVLHQSPFHRQSFRCLADVAVQLAAPQGRFGQGQLNNLDEVITCLDSFRPNIGGDGRLSAERESKLDSSGPPILPHNSQIYGSTQGGIEETEPLEGLSLIIPSSLISPREPFEPRQPT
jgi:hypothetical protein